MKVAITEAGMTMAEVARAAGTAPAYLTQICIGIRKPSLDFCKRIEDATDGKVTRRHVRPDWFDGEAA